MGIKKTMTSKKLMMIFPKKFRITVLRIEMLLRTTLSLTFKMIEENKYTVTWMNFNKTDLMIS